MLIAQGEITTTKNGQFVDGETKDATFVSDDELKAVKKGGEPKQGKLTEYETVPYKEAQAGNTKGMRGYKGDKLTGDHIPSKAALVKAEENKLGRKLNSAEKRQINEDGVTVVLKEDTHENLSRTYGNKNKPLIDDDAKDLGLAFRKDAEAIFQGLHKDKALNSDIVGAYMRAYRENVRKGVFQHSRQADDIFMKYLNKVKTGTPNSTGN